ncbi:MAG: pyridoxamine 5'-phosphate oxidase family protein [Nitrospirae bacterium]|nr:pyridoxamine 5'-phosphate oxidase family protein [Nitrospirota bacterium]
MDAQSAGIDDETAAWIRQQRVFFVATAPLAKDGHVNCSPKGGDAFRVLDPKTVAYQDLTGSGIETVAHVRENGRIVIMFCAFEGEPLIVRLHGRGEVVTPADAEFASLASHFPAHLAMRAIIKVRLTRVAPSCGFGVPRLAYEGPRTQLDAWATKRGRAGLETYRREKNTASLDGLPGLDNP